MEIGLKAKVQPDVDDKKAEEEASRLREQMDEAVQDLAFSFDEEDEMDDLQNHVEAAGAVIEEVNEVVEDSVEKLNEVHQDPQQENVTAFEQQESELIGVFEVMPDKMEDVVEENRLVRHNARRMLSRMDFLSKQVSGLGERIEDMGGRLEAIGGLFKKGAATVAIAGIGLFLLSQMWGGIKKIADTSPLLGTVVTMLGQALQLFFMPFGNIIGQALLPIVSTLLELSASFSRWAMSSNELFETIAGVLETILFDPLSVVADFIILTFAFILLIYEAIVGLKDWFFDKFEPVFDWFEDPYIPLPFGDDGGIDIEPESILRGITRALPDPEEIWDFGGKLKGHLMERIGKMVPSADRFFGGLKKMIPSSDRLLSGIKKAIPKSDEILGLFPTKQEILKAIRGTGTSGKGVANLLEAGGGFLKGGGTSVLRGLTKGLGFSGRGAAKLGGGLFGGAKGLLKGAMSGGLKGAGAGFVAGVPGMGAAGGGLFSGLRGGIRGARGGAQRGGDVASRIGGLLPIGGGGGARQATLGEYADQPGLLSRIGSKVPGSGAMKSVAKKSPGLGNLFDVAEGAWATKEFASGKTDEQQQALSRASGIAGGGIGWILGGGPLTGGAGAVAGDVAARGTTKYSGTLGEQFARRRAGVDVQEEKLGSIGQPIYEAGAKTGDFLQDVEEQGGVGKIMGRGAKKIGDAFDEAIENATEDFEEAWQDLLDAIDQAWKDLTDMIPDMPEAPEMPEIPDPPSWPDMPEPPDMPELPSFGGGDGGGGLLGGGGNEEGGEGFMGEVGASDIGGFAEGGVVTDPTLAMIGEEGETEYVVPKSKIDEFIQAVKSQGLASDIGSLSSMGGTGGRGGQAAGADLSLNLDLSGAIGADAIGQAVANAISDQLGEGDDSEVIAAIQSLESAIEEALDIELDINLDRRNMTDELKRGNKKFEDAKNIDE